MKWAEGLDGTVTRPSVPNIMCCHHLHELSCYMEEGRDDRGGGSSHCYKIWAELRN